MADGGSTDGTGAIVADMAADHEKVRLLENPGRWSSAGRNVAVRRRAAMSCC